MALSFLVLSNMAGIVCASNEDHTLYQLSKKEPLVIAVDPESKFPWDMIINAYKSQTNNSPTEHTSFKEYVSDFAQAINYKALLEEHENEIELDIKKEKRSIIFLGYGTDDIFPSFFKLSVSGFKHNGTLELVEEDYKFVSHKREAFYEFMGDFNNINTLFEGSTFDSRKYLVEKQLEMFENYKQEVIDHFRNTEWENDVLKHFDGFDANTRLKKCMHDARRVLQDKTLMGLESFSVEDMVSAVETLIDANDNLKHLQGGGKGGLKHTQEIAVITRAEGLTWIKHTLFTI